MNLFMLDFLDDDILLFRKRKRNAIYAFLLAHHFPFRQNPPNLHVDCVQHGGANFLFDHADDQTLEKVTRLNLHCFNLIYDRFKHYWEHGMDANSRFAHVHRRALTGRAALGLLLFYMAHGPSHTALALFAGVSLATISRYLKWGRLALSRSLNEIPQATMDCPPEDYLCALGDRIAEIQDPVMRGCVIVVDGSLHPLEKNYEAQDNFFYDKHHPDYNGWKGWSVYFFHV